MFMKITAVAIQCYLNIQCAQNTLQIHFYGRLLRIVLYH